MIDTVSSISMKIFMFNALVVCVAYRMCYLYVYFKGNSEDLAL